METESRSAVVCKPLLGAVGPDLYQCNAFRITGLPVDASTRDISKHANKIKMMVELGHSGVATGGAMPLQPPPTVHQIRAAVETLKDPETRLVHELFWFWPQDFEGGGIDPAFHAWAAGNGEAALRIWTLKEYDPQAGPVARHNLAVFWHLAAVDGARNATGPIDATTSASIGEYWRMSVKRWSALVLDDQFWDRVTIRVRQIDDPRLTVGFARRLRAGLLEALGKIHLDFALRHTTNGNLELVSTHAELLRELVADPGRMAPTFREAINPLKAYLNESVRSTRKACEEHPDSAGKTAIKLIDEIKPLLDILEFICGGRNSVECAETFDAIALAFVQCASIPQPISEAPNVISLLECARSVAVSPGLMQHIDAGLALWNGRSRVLPVCEQLDRVRSSDIPPKSKIWIIRDQILNQLAAILTSDPYNPGGPEARSAIASALKQLAFEAADVQDDWETAFLALDLAAQHACHEELGRQIWADRAAIEKKKSVRQEWLRLEARRETIGKLAETLHGIEADSASPKAAVGHIEQEILPYIASKIPVDQRREAQDCAVESLRRIADLAWTHYQSTTAALHALTVASSVVADSELRSQLALEKDRAEQRYRAQEQQNLLLKIRDDEIEITGLGVRVNDQFLPVDDILGVRWGGRLVDGQVSARMAHQVEFAASYSRVASIDCHRLMRGKSLIKEDFGKIIDACRIRIIPQMIGSIVRKIKSGGVYAISESQPGQFGEDIPGSFGLLKCSDLVLRNGKEEHAHGLRQLGLSFADGALVLRELGAEPALATWHLGQVWNAVFLPELVAALIKQT